MASSFFIVADDLTGAMDSGVQFARLGFPTTLRMGDSGAPAAEPCDEREVLAVTTDSRELPAGAAAALVTAAAVAARGRRPYKKIDSTLRGNLGAELEALMAATGATHALLTPAYPQAGRIMRGGVLFVEGRRLRDGEFARDPACPATDHLPALLEAQCRRAVMHLPLAVVRRGARAIGAACAAAPEGIVVCDALTDDDLHSIAGAALERGERTLACGSAGLARALAGAARTEGRGAMRRAQPRCQRVLVVSGSRRQAAVEQGERAAAGALWPLAAALQRSDAGLALAIDDTLDGEPARAGLLLSVSASPFLEACEADVAQAVAGAAARIQARWRGDGLVLVGGATARAVCAALQIRRLEIVDEILPGVALGRVDDGPWRGLWVATKAGGFGRSDTLIRIVEHLAGGADA